MSKEKQLVFPFIEEQNKIEGKTCETCLHNIGGICDNDMQPKEREDTCVDWIFDEEHCQKNDELDFMEEFEKIIQKYSISLEDKRRIYILANHF